VYPLLQPRNKPGTVGVEQTAETRGAGDYQNLMSSFLCQFFLKTHCIVRFVRCLHVDAVVQGLCKAEKEGQVVSEWARSTTLG
jgi:hypothetical protein